MWSKNHPTKEGYYWVESRGVLTDKSYVHPVRVYSSKKNGILDTVFSDGENFSVKLDRFLQWYTKEIAMPAMVEMSDEKKVKQTTPNGDPIPDLFNADPNCDHNIVCAPSGGGVKCTKCTGWFCY
ncbi:MAG: hypothetical protein IMZ64_05225 [Bacteroidetes bacterium]|nr:hypothetical protein [Bacteroidota bacterium]